MPRRTAMLLAALLPAAWLVVAAPSSWAVTTVVRTDAATVTTRVTTSATVTLPAPASHVAVYWTGNPDAAVQVSFGDGTSFSPPADAGRDEAGEARGDGRTYGAVHVAAGTRVVRVTSDRPLGTVRVLGMADGARTTTQTRVRADASAAVPQPTVLPRSAWGADESLRKNADGTLKQQPTYWPVKKLIVHHTATTNDDPDPAATLRAIYRYHVVTQGWSDIAYNFLVDEQGRTWEGRWSRDYPTGVSPSGDNAAGHGVTGAHTSGWNSGTLGAALLGTLTTRDATPAARSALVDLLAWAAERNGLDPKATTSFTNPVSGATTTTPDIAGHRDYGATECPGDTFATTLPALRDAVAARMAAAPPPEPAPAPAPADTTAPTVPSGVTATPGSARISIAWQASTDDVGVTGYDVLRSSNGKTGSFSQVTSVSALSWTDTSVRRGKTAWYQVRARDAAGNRSAVSATVSATAK